MNERGQIFDEGARYYLNLLQSRIKDCTDVETIKHRIALMLEDLNVGHNDVDDGRKP